MHRKKKSIEKKHKRQRPQKLRALFRSERFRHGSIATAITVGVLIVLVLANVVTGLVTQRFPSVNLDLTPNSVNTLSDSTRSVAEGVQMETNLYILANEENAINDLVYSEYGVTYSQVATLAKKLQECNPLIHVSYIDLDTNPGFARNYPEENLMVGDVIVQTQQRYRVLTVDDLFQVQYGDSGNIISSSKVDGTLASALYQTNASELPLIAIATGHDELLPTDTLSTVLSANGFQTQSFSLLTDEIPEDAQIVLLPTPSTDYTDEELQKLTDFLEDDSVAQERNVMVTFHTTQTGLPNLDTFLADWGLQVGTDIVLESDSSHLVSSNDTYLLAQYDAELEFGGKSDYGYLVLPQSRPVTKLFSEKDGVRTYSLLSSYDTSYLFPADSVDQPTGDEEKKSYSLAALAQKQRSVSGKEYASNVLVFGCSTMFTSGIIDTSTFGDAEFVRDLLQYATGSQNDSAEIQIIPTAINDVDLVMTDTELHVWGLGVFTLLIPAVILAIGLFVYLKRRHL